MTAMIRIFSLFRFLGIAALGVLVGATIQSDYRSTIATLSGVILACALVGLVIGHVVAAESEK